MKVTVSGASDDLVEVDGDLSEEFGGDEVTLVFGDGTHPLVRYAEDGCWRVSLVKQGTATYRHVFTATDSDSDNYSDRAELEGDLISVDMVRDHREIVRMLGSANWRAISDDNAQALYALAKKAGAL